MLNTAISLARVYFTMYLPSSYRQLTPSGEARRRWDFGNHDPRMVHPDGTQLNSRISASAAASRV